MLGIMEKMEGQTDQVHLLVTMKEKKKKIFFLRQYPFALLHVLRVMVAQLQQN